MKAYALTDIGKMRKVNQDAQFASTEPVGELSNLFVVADGMGGHAGFSDGACPEKHGAYGPSDRHCGA